MASPERRTGRFLLARSHHGGRHASLLLLPTTFAMMNRRPLTFRLPNGRRNDKTVGAASVAGVETSGSTSGTTHNEAFLQDVEVRVPNLVVVTADHADPRVNSSVQEVLRLMRDYKGVDVVFVADLTECGRHSTYGPAAEDTVEHVSESTDSLEALWGERVVDDRAQHECAQEGHAAGGRHIHSRIVSASGKVYGTLCCICVGDTASAFRVDQKMLRHTAALTASKIEKSLLNALSLEPKTP